MRHRKELVCIIFIIQVYLVNSLDYLFKPNDEDNFLDTNKCSDHPNDNIAALYDISKMKIELHRGYATVLNGSIMRYVWKVDPSYKVTVCILFS